jgi:hypothetical protein
MLLATWLARVWRRDEWLCWRARQQWRAVRCRDSDSLTMRRANGPTIFLIRKGRWCEHHRRGALVEIEPLHVAAYIEALGKDFEKPTVKKHRAAIRTLFDWLVTGQVVATNPAHAVRGPRHVVKTGQTTVLDAEQARRLLDGVDTSTVVGLRDRALISVMTFAFARIGPSSPCGSRTLPEGQALVGPAA